MIQLLALDLDGTLVRRDGTVDPRDRQAVAALQGSGVQVTLVTGRLYAGTHAIAASLGLRAPVACADGAELVEQPSGRELEHRGIAGRIAERLRERLREHELASFLMVQEGVLHDAQGSPYVRYVRNWSPELRRVADVLTDAAWRAPRGLSAALAVGPTERMAPAVEALRADGELELFDFRVARAFVGEGLPPLRGVLVHAAGVHKGSALARIAERCGCGSAEVAAVGDWLNDVDMLAWAGRSFAMAHAPEAVKRAAGEVLAADGQSGGGVAEAIGRCWPELAAAASETRG